MKKLFVLSILVVAILLAARPVFAQTAKGENVAALKDSVTTKMAGGKTYMTVGSRQICTTADPKHPLNGASGDCDGACVMDAAGAATCMGSCTWVDRDGDIAFSTWDGQTEGSWKLAGGSGKWKGSTGQGTWKNTSASAPGNFARNSWEGTMSMAAKK
jgi:hypothetical protein